MDTTVVSQYIGEGPPRPGSGESRKIPGGPLYKAMDVLNLLHPDFPAVKLWTHRCHVSVLAWKLKEKDLCELVGTAVDSLDQFHDSEWCLQGPDGPWAACDAYLVKRKRLPRAIAKIGMGFYVKFAIHYTGRRLLLVSCHPSNRRKEK